MAMIAITKMGGIAGPLFSALGPEAVKDRALDSGARFVVTSPYLYKRLEPVLDDIVDVEKYIIVGDNSDLGEDTINFDEVMASGDPSYPTVSMAPTDPYILHYTSGSTGKPKGVLLVISRWYSNGSRPATSRPPGGGHLLVHRRPRMGHWHILRHIPAHGTWERPSYRTKEGSTPGRGTGSSRSMVLLSGTRRRQPSGC